MRRDRAAPGVTEGVASNEQRYRTLVEMSPMAIIRLDTAHRVEFLNPAAQRLFGYEPAEVVGTTLPLVPPGARRDNDRFLAEAAARKHPGRLETARLHKNGSVIEVELHTAPMFDECGGYIGQLVLCVDLGTRRAAERALQESEARYRTVIDSLSEIVFEADGAGRVVYLNRAWEAITGATVEAAIGRACEDLVVPAARLQVREAFDRLMDGDAERVAFEMPAVLQGRPGWLDVRATARRRPDGSFAGMSGVMTDITERRDNEERLSHLALHDALTGLPNRSLLTDRLSRAIVRCRRDDEAAAVMFVDLDHFKIVNDSLGHHVGDELLVAVAERLRSALRDSETVARVGSDQFIVLAEGLDDPTAALGIAERLQRTLRSPVRAGGIEHSLGMSVGVATVDAATPRTAAEVLVEADLAMRRAKDRGRNRVEVFEAGLRAQSEARLRTEAALRQALTGDELEVFYQPVINLRTGALQGAEALLRWRHPEHGLVPPAEFIPTAEETGLIGPMTELVLRRSLADFARWPDLHVAVNVSPHQLVDPAFPEVVARALRSSSVDPHRLTLEITETAVLADPRSCLPVLHELRDQGLVLALDDFGTGFSALTHLHELPVGCVKIDRSFVAGVTVNGKSRALVRAVSDLAAALELQLVAEGVETEEQARVLRTMACPAAQGFLYARPLPLADFVRFAEAANRSAVA